MNTVRLPNFDSNAIENNIVGLIIEDDPTRKKKKQDAMALWIQVFFIFASADRLGSRRCSKVSKWFSRLGC